MIAMQTRCVHCVREQYALAVWDISHGQHPCCFCGEMSREMTCEEYNKNIREMRKNENKKHR